MPGRSKQWEEDEEESSSAESTTAAAAAGAAGTARRKFDDEEEGDSDVLDSWDAAEDSEAEREKVKKAAEAKAKAEAEAKANKKSKAQRVAERQAERARALAEGDDGSSDEETEAQKRERLRRTEKDADLRHAEDLFGSVGISGARKGTTAGSAVVVDARDPTHTVNLGAMPLFNPATKAQFEALRETLVPIVGALHSRPHYTLFLQELAKQLARELPSDQVKKIASTLTTLSNEKMKSEKAGEKGGKKTKAAKTKTTLQVSRPGATDTNTYEEEFGDDDFM